ncbi:HET domain containing protein [Rhypophila decipiens]
MRLIDTTTLHLHEFYSAPEPYAILSHTWEDDEVGLQDMSHPGVTSKQGYKKIVETCRMARSAGIRYAWVDTCCIDKSSSAELSEAINSMYRWYKEAAVCYAYISDIPHRSLQDSRWFTRGWTLQELIAPEEVEFYDSDWNHVGSKMDSKLLNQLSSITGIPKSVLDGQDSPFEYSVAYRMSWAASRQTTRVEDTAYCLLGIFGVHMPMIYGEGENAFRRLQEEIIKRVNDLTIFSWDHVAPTDPITSTGRSTGSSESSLASSTAPRIRLPGGLRQSSVDPLFASSPAAFGQGANPLLGDFWEFAVTNKGLVCNMMISVFFALDIKKQVYAVLLGDRIAGGYMSKMVLRKIGPGLYFRWADYSTAESPSSWRLESVEDELPGIRPSLPYHILVDPTTAYRARFAIFREEAIRIPISQGITLLNIAPSHLWDKTDRLFLKPDAYKHSRYKVTLLAEFGASVGQERVSIAVVCNYGVQYRYPVCKVGLGSKEFTDLISGPAHEMSLSYEDLTSRMPAIRTWGAWTYYEGSPEATHKYEISVSTEEVDVRCECATNLVMVNSLVVEVARKSV